MAASKQAVLLVQREVFVHPTPQAADSIEGTLTISRRPSPPHSAGSEGEEEEEIVLEWLPSMCGGDFVLVDADADDDNNNDNPNPSNPESNNHAAHHGPPSPQRSRAAPAGDALLLPPDANGQQARAQAQAQAQAVPRSTSLGSSWYVESSSPRIGRVSAVPPHNHHNSHSNNACAPNKPPPSLRDMYAVTIPLSEITGLRRYTPTLGIAWVVVIVKGNVPLTPLYFHAGGVRQFFGVLAQYAHLLRSSSDPMYWDVVTERDCLSNSINSLDLSAFLSACAPAPDHHPPLSPPQAGGSSGRGAGSGGGRGHALLAERQGAVSEVTERIVERFSSAVKLARESAMGPSWWAPRGPPNQQPRQREQQQPQPPHQSQPSQQAQQQAQPLGGSRSTHSSGSAHSLFPSVVSAPSDLGAFELLPDHGERGIDVKVWRGEPLKEQRWRELMDSQGRIADPALVKTLVFRGGVDPSIRKEVWKFLLGYYPWNSTYAERTALVQQKQREYVLCKQQWENITPQQAKRFHKFRDREHRIDKDVVRTDRSHALFAQRDGHGLAMLRRVLMTYAFYNFDLGYCQGMSDLASPLVCVVEDESEVFWCFVHLMERMAGNFDKDQASMHKQLAQIQQLIRLLDPALHDHLDEQGALNCFFLFRWVLILFKRELPFDHVMRLWEVLWTDHLTPHFHLFCVVGVLCSHSAAIVHQHMGFDEILKFVNELEGKIDLDVLLLDGERTLHAFRAASRQDDI